jgi:hypothetical protein
MKFKKRIIEVGNKIKDETNFYRAAAPKVLKAYTKKLIGDKPENKVQEFRKEQCESCLLFTGSNCSKEMVASHSGDKLPYSQAIKAGIVTKDSYDNIRTVTIDNKTYYRGCGCPLTGSTAKWKFDFDDKELSLKDGTAPCPMGKWSVDNFNKWKNKK